MPIYCPEKSGALKWLNMSTGFSVTPLRATTYLGLAISFVAVLLVTFFVIIRFTGPLFFDQNIPPGWSSTIAAITFFAGLQLSMLGILGEYIGRLFLTVNGQPQFLIRDTFGITPTGERDDDDQS